MKYFERCPPGFLRDAICYVGGKVKSIKFYKNQEYAPGITDPKKYCESISGRFRNPQEHNKGTKYCLYSPAGKPAWCYKIMGKKRLGRCEAKDLRVVDKCPSTAPFALCSADKWYSYYPGGEFAPGIRDPKKHCESVGGKFKLLGHNWDLDSTAPTYSCYTYINNKAVSCDSINGKLSKLNIEKFKSECNLDTNSENLKRYVPNQKCSTKNIAGKCKQKNRDDTFKFSYYYDFTETGYFSILSSKKRCFNDSKEASWEVKRKHK